MFTELVQRLAAGALPDGREFARLWAALREALRGELRRRGLWGHPPSFVGVYGWRSWDDAGVAPASPGASPFGISDAGAGDALEELTAACYSFIFVDRLRSLTAQLRVKPDVDGLVRLNIRHFMHELQKHHDPLGYRVFAVAHAAVLRALARGEATVLAGDPRVRNDTVLGFSGGAPAASASAASAAESEADLRLLAGRWSDSLLPDLITAPAGRQAELAERLSRWFADLPRHGIGALLFKELLDPMKRHVRLRWAALLAQAGDGGAAPGHGGSPESDSRAVRPDRQLEDRSRFEALTRCVAAAIDRLDVDTRTRGHLARLWRFLSAGAAQHAAPAWDGVEADDLSQRKLALRLGIPRKRLPELRRTLARVAEGCLADSRSAAAPQPAAARSIAAAVATAPEAASP